MSGDGSFDKEDPVAPRVTVRKDGDHVAVDGSFDEEDPDAPLVTVLADSDPPVEEGRPGPNQEPAAALELEAPSEAARISSGWLSIRAPIALGCAA